MWAKRRTSLHEKWALFSHASCIVFRFVGFQDMADDVISKYSWSDGKKRVSIYIELDGANSRFRVEFSFGLSLSFIFYCFLSDLLIGVGFVTGVSFTMHL